MYTSSKLFSIFMVKIFHFLKVNKIPYQKNRFLVNLGSFFSTYKIFPGRGWLFPVSTIIVECFHGKTRSLAGLKKVIFSAKLPTLAIYDYQGPHINEIFATYGKSFKKALEHLLREVVWIIMLKIGLSIFSGLRGASCFASRHFPKSVILASCNFLGRRFLTSYARSIAIFHFSQNYSVGC